MKQDSVGFESHRAAGLHQHLPPASLLEDDSSSLALKGSNISIFWIVNAVFFFFAFWYLEIPRWLLIPICSCMCVTMLVLLLEGSMIKNPETVYPSCGMETRDRLLGGEELSLGAKSDLTQHGESDEKSSRITKCLLVGNDAENNYRLLIH